MGLAKRLCPRDTKQNGGLVGPRPCDLQNSRGWKQALVGKESQCRQQLLPLTLSLWNHFNLWNHWCGVCSFSSKFTYPGPKKALIPFSYREVNWHLSESYNLRANGMKKPSQSWLLPTIVSFTLRTIHEATCKVLYSILALLSFTVTYLS